MSLPLAMNRLCRHAPARTLWVALGLLCLALPVALAAGAGDGQPKTALRTESFDKDPGWEGHNNRIVPERLPTVTQNFGYSKTNFAGKGAGELGGQITRAS